MADPRKDIALRAVAGDEDAMGELLLRSSTEEMEGMSPIQWARRVAEVSEDQPVLDPDENTKLLREGFDGKPIVVAPSKDPAPPTPVVAPQEQ
ncbi:MAG: hypothetical protein Unbinned2514contig1000_11 [Prokaryotic dsDNA virus sp.]|nr:MAG: hypothetical protein Unbinned2514contig1000_11 [Prokaryotic dsDNA virus sp.]|tara:strand:- start:6192 stop:6470 length:279 start_codon:yes stop_codon:yes gene_type:complete